MAQQQISPVSTNSASTVDTVDSGLPQSPRSPDQSEPMELSANELTVDSDRENSLLVPLDTDESYEGDPGRTMSGTAGNGNVPEIIVTDEKQKVLTVINN